MTIRHILTINPGHKASSNINELHKLVMSGYGYALDDNDTDARATHNILFHARPARIDTEHYPPRASRVEKLLVQADIPGDWTNTVYADDNTLGLHIGEPITVTHDFSDGDHIELSALLNATTSIPAPADAPLIKGRRPRGRRVPITNASDVIDWAAQQFANHGLNLDTATITVDKPVRYLGYKNSAQFVVDARPITAHGTVTNTTALTTALTTGLGRCRPYGTGLIRHRTHH